MGASAGARTGTRLSLLRSAYRGKHLDDVELIVNLQLLRFFAASAIVLLHSFAGLNRLGFESSAGNWLMATAGSGVDIFFVLSGFVIHRSVSSGQITASSFIVARLQRLIPNYWMATILMTAIIFVVHTFGRQGNEKPVDFSYFATSMTFTAQLLTNDHPVLRPGWSLEFEMGFYCLVTCALLLRSGWRATFLLGGLAAWAAISGQLFVLEFALGVLASGSNLLKGRGRLSAIVSLVGVLLLGLSSLWPDQETAFKWGIPGLMVVIGLANTRQVRSKVWIYLGRISFPLYLFHLVAISVLQYPFLHVNLNLGSGWAAIVIYFIGSLATAVFVDRFMDRPIQNYLSTLRVRGKI